MGCSIKLIVPNTKEAQTANKVRKFSKKTKKQSDIQLVRFSFLCCFAKFSLFIEKTF